MISLSRVSVRVGSRHLLRCVSLSVPTGSVTGILGPNGAGKTTLLRACSGELKPTDGCVTLLGKSLAAWTDRKRARHVSFLSQDQPLNFPLRVWQVVALGLLPFPELDAAGVQSVVGRALDTFALRDLANRTYPSLSGGERQRVHLARVLAQHWRGGGHALGVLLLDEPTNHLDLEHEQRLSTLLRELATAGASVLIASHNIPFLSAVADRMVLLNRGAVQATGPTKEILLSPLPERILGVRLTAVSIGGVAKNQRPIFVPRFEFQQTRKEV
ncbi:MAG: ATP-binding cassette domain-containing protein [Candidatus Binatia bacterium]|nr:ATP-binding cassette domain-containing protein [Candidatus Binatia bacterium]